MAIKTDENHAKGFGLALDSGSKLGCDVPSANPTIHLWGGERNLEDITIANALVEVKRHSE